MVCFSALFTSFKRAPWQHVSQILRSISLHHLETNQWTYNSAARATRNWQAALRHANKRTRASIMKHFDGNWATSIQLFSHSFDHFCSSALVTQLRDRWELAVSHLQKAMSMTLKPDNQVYTAVISSIKERKHWPKSLAILQLPFARDSISYAALPVQSWTMSFMLLQDRFPLNLRIPSTLMYFLMYF